MSNASPEHISDSSDYNAPEGTGSELDELRTDKAVRAMRDGNATEAQEAIARAALPEGSKSRGEAYDEQ